jgi:hypothetical protein
MAMLLMSQRDVGTYVPQPVGNQQTLEAVGTRVNIQPVADLATIHMRGSHADSFCINMSVYIP